MIVIKNKLIPFGRYTTINLFGILFTKKDITKKINNHEKIHTVQIIEMAVVSAILISIIIFIANISFWWIFASIPSYYVWYCVEYMIICIMHDSQSCSYHDVSFEEEAYNNDDNLDYIPTRKPFAWIKYIKSESNHKDNKNCCK